MFGEFQKFVIDNRESEELSGYKEIGSYTIDKKEEEIAGNDDKIRKQKDFVKQKEFDKMNFFQRKWMKFDEKIMKPFFLGTNENENDISNQASLISLQKKPEMIEFSTKSTFGQN